MFERYLEKKDLPRLISATFLLIITNIAALHFFIWIFQYIAFSVYSVIYIIAEIIGFIYFNFTAITYLNMRFHRRHPPIKDFNPTVDVFIPCCGEDMHIVERTLRAAKNIDYANKKLYVLDDGKSARLEALSKDLGFIYLTRGDRQGFKANNLNNGMQNSSGEFILILDADQAPRSYIIKKLIGYFVRDNIAFVQSVQTCITPEDDPYNSQDKVFNRSVELSKDVKNAAISCGSGVIYRRKALDDINGFSTWNLVEDLHTSYKLQQKGYVGIFFNYALSKGIAPPDYLGVARQRHKWATDTMRIFLWDNPLFKKGLGVLQKIHYFNLGLLYLYTGICMPIFFILPIWSLLTNSFITTRPASEYLLYRMPYFALAIILNNFIFRTKNMVKVYQTWNFFFPIFIQGIIDALRNRRLKMDVIVTAKKEDKAGIFPWWATAKVQATILLAYIISLFYAILVWGINKDIFFTNTLWVMWGLFILSPLTINVFLEQYGHIIHKRIYTVSNKVLVPTLGAILLSLLAYYALPVGWNRYARVQSWVRKPETISIIPALGEVTSSATPAEKLKASSYNYTLTPVFSLYWQDTDYRRINEGFNLKVDAKKAFQMDFTYFYSHLRSNPGGHLGRNSLRIGYAQDFSDRFSSSINLGLNSYTDSVGETFTTTDKITYNHSGGNIAFEYSRYDIIDTTNIFVPRYYTLVTDVQAARHKIITNDFKGEFYQTLCKNLAFYANLVYGKYSDNNIKRTLYASPILFINSALSVKYGFVYLDVRNPSPYYFAHQDSKIHQVRLEYVKPFTAKLSFGTEGVLSYEINKGIGASTFFNLGYKLTKNTYLDVSANYSYARDNPNHNNINSLNFNTSLKIEF